MANKNNPYGYNVISEGNEVTNSKYLFENDDAILGNEEQPNSSFENSKNDNAEKKNGVVGIPCQILDEEGNIITSLPEIIYDLFEREYGIKIEYDSDNMLIYYISDIQTNLSVSAIAKSILVKELKQRNNNNKIVLGLENLIVKPQNRPSGPAVTIGQISWFDLSYFDSSFNFKKGFIYQNFNDEASKRTTNLAKVFEHDYLFHNVKSIDNSKQENIRQPKYIGAYKPGKVEERVNEIRNQIGLQEYLALNYQLVKNGKSIKYFGSIDQLKLIKSVDDLEANSNAQLIST